MHIYPGSFYSIKVQLGYYIPDRSEVKASVFVKKQEAQEDGEIDYTKSDSSIVGNQRDHAGCCADVHNAPEIVITLCVQRKSNSSVKLGFDQVPKGAYC